MLATTGKKVIRERPNLVEVPLNKDPHGLEIPENKKVQKILEGPPARERWGYLLCKEDKYEIGYNHKQLLRILRSIDSTIEYCNRERQLKVLYYNTLRLKMKESMRVTISHKHLQQLLFIDGDLYKVEWANNPAIKDYDLLLTLPPYTSEDTRVNEVRNKIVRFLMAMELEYLEKNNLTKAVPECWSEGFDPSAIDIPVVLLPSHPVLQNAEIRNMSREEISKVPSKQMREIFNRKKDEAESKSQVSDDIVRMIFSKQSNASIKEKLHAAIK
jgi:hypothetical protein